jgi:acetoin utilization protein AcuB
MYVKSVMRGPVVTVSERTSLREVRELMEIFRVRQVPVLRGPELVGMVAETQVREAAWLTASRVDVVEGGEMLRAEHVMTRNVPTVSPETPVAQALGLALRLEESRSPIGSPLAVVEGAELVGMVSLRDLAGALEPGPPGRGRRLEHVLLAIRGTGAGEDAAAREAAAVARAHQARLTLIQVLPALPSAILESGLSADQLQRLERTRRRVALDRLLTRVPREPGVGWLVVEGDPADEILRAARRLKVDLLVIGDDDAEPARAARGGGVATRVLDEATSRVWVVGRGWGLLGELGFLADAAQAPRSAPVTS